MLSVKMLVFSKFRKGQIFETFLLPAMEFCWQYGQAFGEVRDNLLAAVHLPMSPLQPATVHLFLQAVDPGNVCEKPRKEQQTRF